MIDLQHMVGFDWDEGNARKNGKHGISPSEVEQLFFNVPLLLAEDEPHSNTEARFRGLGVSDTGRRLHVTFTLRDERTTIRPISARPMSRKERSIYEKAPETNS